MSTYTRLPTSETLHSLSTRPNHFMHAAPYAPRPRTTGLPEKSLVRWEDEGGSLADPPSA